MCSCIAERRCHGTISRREYVARTSLSSVACAAMLFRSIAISFVFVGMVGCGGGNSNSPDSQGGPPCSDHIDNDGDGTIDFPDDLGCEDENDETEDSPAKPACS